LIITNYYYCQMSQLSTDDDRLYTTYKKIVISISHHTLNIILHIVIVK